MRRAVIAIISIASMAFFMTGCSSLRLVDTNVTAFSRWTAAPPGPGTPYRFERLPSQQAIGNPQDLLENLARTSLAKVGMDLKPEVAKYSVQVVLNTQVMQLNDGYDGFGPWGGFGRPGVFLGAGNYGSSLGLSFPLGGMSRPYFKRDLTILMRDVASNQVVFESRALHDGIWSDTLAVAPAMLDAALNGFPQPAPGTRRINTEISR